MTLTIGLVVEGKDDFRAIESAIRGEFVRQNLSKPEFKRLQPENDATGQTQSGGWSKVVGWLIANEGQKVETYFRSVFADDPACDLIVIHLDSDIYSDCLRMANIGYDANGLTVSGIVNLMRTAITSWLKPESDRESSFAYAIPVHKTENWILASMPDCADEVWTHPDAKRNLKSQFDVTKHRSIASMIEGALVSVGQDNSFLLARAKSYQLFVEHLNSARESTSP